MSGRLLHPRFGLDYAWTTISPQAHKAVGSSFAARYLSTDASKNLSRAEADGLRKNGIDVVTVWETSANRALDGQAAGVADAQQAQQQAQSRGAPARAVIYFAVDFDATGNEGATDAYFDGAASVLGKDRCGPYGGLSVVTHQLDRGFGYAWQTYAWSFGKWDQRAQLQQFSNDHTVGGSSCDYDHAVYADFGQWDYKPPAVPVDYSRFPANEAKIVKQYDSLIPHKSLHPVAIRRLRKQMLHLAELIYEAASWDATQGAWAMPPNWGVHNRGWRFHELRLRGKGLK